MAARLVRGEYIGLISKNLVLQAKLVRTKNSPCSYSYMGREDVTVCVITCENSEKTKSRKGKERVGTAAQLYKIHFA